ncbi:hypothetical protein ACFLZY_00120 [Patescibacteria group bacterium]
MEEEMSAIGSATGHMVEETVEHKLKNLTTKAIEEAFAESDQEGLSGLSKFLRVVGKARKVPGFRMGGRALAGLISDKIPADSIQDPWFRLALQGLKVVSKGSITGVTAGIADAEEKKLSDSINQYLSEWKNVILSDHQDGFHKVRIGTAVDGSETRVALCRRYGPKKNEWLENNKRSVRDGKKTKWVSKDYHEEVMSLEDAIEYKGEFWHCPACQGSLLFPHRGDEKTPVKSWFAQVGTHGKKIAIELTGDSDDFEGDLLDEITTVEPEVWIDAVKDVRVVQGKLQETLEDGYVRDHDEVKQRLIRVIWRLGDGETEFTTDVIRRSKGAFQWFCKGWDKIKSLFPNWVVTFLKSTGAFLVLIVPLVYIAWPVYAIYLFLDAWVMNPDPPFEAMNNIIAGVVLLYLWAISLSFEKGLFWILERFGIEPPPSIVKERGNQALFFFCLAGYFLTIIFAIKCPSGTLDGTHLFTLTVLSGLAVSLLVDRNKAKEWWKNWWDEKSKSLIRVLYLSASLIAIGSILYTWLGPTLNQNDRNLVVLDPTEIINTVSDETVDQYTKLIMPDGSFFILEEVVFSEHQKLYNQILASNGLKDTLFEPIPGLPLPKLSGWELSVVEIEGEQRVKATSEFWRYWLGPGHLEYTSEDDVDNKRAWRMTQKRKPWYLTVWPWNRFDPNPPLPAEEETEVVQAEPESAEESVTVAVAEPEPESKPVAEPVTVKKPRKKVVTRMSQAEHDDLCKRLKFIGAEAAYRRAKCKS